MRGGVSPTIPPGGPHQSGCLCAPMTERGRPATLSACHGLAPAGAECSAGRACSGRACGWEHGCHQLSRTRRGALDVQTSELRRIERDLHDGAQMRLVALSMTLGRAEERYRHDSETAMLLREAREDATAAIRELRELARGIAPPVLTDRGLEAAVRSLAHRSGIKVRVSGALDRRPRPAIETAAYFVVAESLTNAAKHAGGAPVEVRLDERGGDLFVEITDFGPGGANPTGGGLTGLRQRVEALDGVLHVTSPSGVGTQVEAVLPCVS
jgi:signal transduction histidine kinase